MTPRICDDNPAGIDAGFKVSTNSSWATVIFDADDSESGRGFLLRKEFFRSDWLDKPTHSEEARILDAQGRS